MAAASEVMEMCLKIMTEYGTGAAQWTVEDTMRMATECVVIHYEETHEPWAPAFRDDNMSYSKGGRKPDFVPGTVWQRLHDFHLIMPQRIWRSMNAASVPISWREAQYPPEQYKILPGNLRAALVKERNLGREAGKMERLADAMVAHLLAAKEEDVRTHQWASLMEAVERMKEVACEELRKSLLEAQQAGPSAAPELTSAPRAWENTDGSEATGEVKTPDLKWEMPLPAADSAGCRPSTTWLVEAMDGYRVRTKSTGFKYPCNPGYAPGQWQGLMKLYRGVMGNDPDRDAAARELVAKMDKTLEQRTSRPITLGAQGKERMRSSQVPHRAPPMGYQDMNLAMEWDDTVWKERSLEEAWEAYKNPLVAREARTGVTAQLGGHVSVDDEGFEHNWGPQFKTSHLTSAVEPAVGEGTADRDPEQRAHESQHRGEETCRRSNH